MFVQLRPMGRLAKASNENTLMDLDDSQDERAMKNLEDLTAAFDRGAQSSGPSMSQGSQPDGNI